MSDEYAVRPVGRVESPLVLTWLDRADRDVTHRAPARRPRPATDRRVFSTRSPDRPNPIGLHRVAVREIDELRVRVSDLEALDGTPILDVKPYWATNADGGVGLAPTRPGPRAESARLG